MSVFSSDCSKAFDILCFVNSVDCSKAFDEVNLYRCFVILLIVAKHLTMR